MKTCKCCGQEKELDSYYRHRSGNPYAYCKSCHRDRQQEWKRRNPGKHREFVWRNKYGIDLTSEQYEEMHRLQKGLCKICGRPEPASGRRLAVDHSHVTGEIRGLLCTKCNTTVGWVEMHPALITYLERKTP
jgi:hypothetical protein